MRTLDVHSHFIPRTLFDQARRGKAIDGLRIETIDGQYWVVHRQGFRHPLDPSMHDLEARIAAMDAGGIDVAVISLTPTQFFYGTDGAECAEFSRQANDDLAAFVAGSKERLIGLATLPMQDPDAACAELIRAVDDLGLRGAQIGTNVEGRPLDGPESIGVLECAHRLDVPLLIHPYYVTARAGMEDFYLTNGIGIPLDTTTCAARLILSGVLDRLERLRIVLVHGGGFLPYQIGRLDQIHAVREEARACRLAPSAYLRRFHYDTVTHAPAALRYLIDLVGVDRVVYGTDFPFDMAGGSFDEQTDGVALDEPSDQRIRCANAAELFGLKVGL